MTESLGLRDRDVPAVPRFRRHARTTASRKFSRAERKFDLMGELGADLLMICSNVAPDSWAESIAQPPTFISSATWPRTQMRVGFEALAWGRHISDYRDAWEVVRRADIPRSGSHSTASISCPADRPRGHSIDPSG